MIRALLRVVAVGACALTLGGCISVLPKSKPAQLYRFAADAAAEAAPAQAGSGVGVFLSGGTFEREAAGDRLLTFTQDRAAYIARARWVAPAQVLFDQAVQDAFDRGGRVRLVSRGELARIEYVLRLDVRSFETRYDHGAHAAPQVVVRVRASLTRGQDRTLVSDQMFEASVRAHDNRVGAIVDAYGEAVSQVLAKLVGWTGQQAA